MFTRCPTCATTFRVTPEQLKARLGRVRCGQCHAVFNALDALVEEVPLVTARPATSSPPNAVPSILPASEAELQVQEILTPRRHGEPEAPSAAENQETTAPAAFLDVEVVNLDEAFELPVSHEEEASLVTSAAEPSGVNTNTEHAVADELIGELMAEIEHLPPAPAVLETPPATALDMDHAAEIEAANDPVHQEPAADVGRPPTVAEWHAAAPELVSESFPVATLAADALDVTEGLAAPLSASSETSPSVTEDYLSAEPNPLLHESAPRERRWLWALGSGMGLGVLLIQLVLHYRVELAVLAPQLKPALEAACQPLGCTVPLPHKIDLLSIESSDLHPGSQKSRLSLVATLKNKAPFAQELPRLEITLTDVADRVLIVKALQPAEYLPKDFRVDQGFPAKKEINVDLTLDVGDTPAAGYRLYLYHP